MEKQKFKLDKWNVEQILEMAREDKLSLPKFQRGLTWKQKRRESLIATMREGNPIGTILLNEAIPNEKYQIIDGLQRISTILDYKFNFTKYFDGTFIPEELVSKIVDIYFNYHAFKIDKKSNAYKKQIHGINNLLVDSYIEIYGRKDHNSRNYGRAVFKAFPSDYQILGEESEDILQNLEDIFDEIFSYIVENEKLRNFDIPLIIYTGDESSLPDIFEKLNTGAVILSKYEIFSARWVNNDIGKVNEVLFSLLKNKYEAITEGEEGYDIEYDNADGDDFLTMNLFEYCFSIGEYIQNSPKNRNTSNTQLFKDKNNIGFELLSLLVTSRINATEYLEYLFGSDLLGYSNLNDDLSTELFEAVDAVLRQMTFLDDFVISNNKIVMYSDYQKIHIFVSLFRKQYHISHNVVYSDKTIADSDNFINLLEGTSVISSKNDLGINSLKTNIIKKKSDKNLMARFKQNVLPAILDQTLTRHWNTYRQVSDLEYQVDSNIDIYFKKLDSDNLEMNLVGWLDEQTKDRKYQRARIQQDVQLVNTLLHHLLQLYSPQYGTKINHDNKIDFDHIIPKSILQKIYEKAPTSGALNIWPIYYSDNRSKKTRSIEDICIRPIKEIDKDFYNLIGISDKAINIASTIKDKFEKEQLLENYNEYLKLRRENYIKLVLDVTKNISEYRFG